MPSPSKQDIPQKMTKTPLTLLCVFISKSILFSSSRLHSSHEIRSSCTRQFQSMMLWHPAVSQPSTFSRVQQSYACCCSYPASNSVGRRCVLGCQTRTVLIGSLPFHRETAHSAAVRSSSTSVSGGPKAQFSTEA